MGDPRPTKVVGGGAGGSFALGSPRGPWVMRQDWRDLLFLHWEWDAEAIQATLPRGLTVDTFDDGGVSGPRAYLGVVPFQMQRVLPRGLAGWPRRGVLGRGGLRRGVPGVSSFGELNLRTYVRGPDGRPGVWFYSLDAHQRLAVWLARRLFALPYHYARIYQVEPTRAGRERRIEYHWSRLGSTQTVDRGGTPRPAAFEYRVEVDGTPRPTTAGTLDFWLVERYLLFSRRPLRDFGSHDPEPTEAEGPRERLYVGRVEHEPYPLRPVTLDRYESSIFSLNGFDPPTAPPVSVLWSPGVDVEVYRLHEVDA